MHLFEMKGSRDLYLEPLLGRLCGKLEKHLDKVPLPLAENGDLHGPSMQEVTGQALPDKA